MHREAIEDEPFIATFILVLPDPLPLPHGSTWTRQLDEREPLLDGVEVRPFTDLKFLTIQPDGGEGYNFVSLRFWQLPDEQSVTPEFLHRSSLATRVVKALSSGPTTEPGDLLHIELEDYSPYRTVVEAATFVARDEELVAGDSKPDPLTRCIDALTGFHRSYRVIAHRHIAELTYERLHPAVLWLHRPAFDAKAKQVPAGIVMLENRNFAVPEYEPITLDTQTNVTQFSVRLTAGDPFALYAERRLEAGMEVWTTGRMGESIVQTGIAAELLFDALLGLMMWEEHDRGSMSLQAAADILSLDLTPRLRNHYANRLGGQWSLKKAPMNGWSSEIAGIRNRVVHGGARPDKHAAADAVEALLAVEQFVGDRLAARWRTYPRTAWMFLGTPGFEKRGKLRTADEWLRRDGGTIVSWAREYQSWREQVNALVTRRRQS